MERNPPLFDSFLHVESSSRSYLRNILYILLCFFFHLCLFRLAKYDSELILRETIAMYYVNEPLSVLEVSSRTFKGHNEKRVSVTVYKIDVLRRECSLL